MRVTSVLVSLFLIVPAAFAQTEPPPPGAETLPAISVSTVAPRLMRERVIASGLVDAVEMVQVQPLIEGQPIESLEADVGDKVTEGQVLARLSLSTLELQRSQFTASLASAKATIAQAEAQVLEARSSADEARRVTERTTQLRKQGAASQASADTAQAAAISANARVMVATQTLEAARAQVALVEAQLENVELQLARTNVVAPVAGEIVQRNAQVGAIASAAGTAMFSMIRDGALELRADVAERDLLRLKPGQGVRMTTVGGTAPLTGTVRLVEPSIDTETRLGRARISIDSPDAVRVGMFVDAEILLAERETLVVPVTAVGSGPEGDSVMRVTEGEVARVPVTTGIRDAGFVEITGGLARGDLVVTRSAAFVRDGDRVNPVPSEPTN